MRLIVVVQFFCLNQMPRVRVQAGPATEVEASAVGELEKKGTSKRRASQMTESTVDHVDPFAFNEPDSEKHTRTRAHSPCPSMARPTKQVRSDSPAYSDIESDSRRRRRSLSLSHSRSPSPVQAQPTALPAQECSAPPVDRRPSGAPRASNGQKRPARRRQFEGGADAAFAARCIKFIANVTKSALCGCVL